MNSTTRTVILVMLCLLPIGAALGFWSGVQVSSGSFYAVHQDITAEALGQPLYYFGTNGPYNFSNKAINAVNAVHYFADDVLGYDQRDHFDNESLRASYTTLSNRYAQLQNVLTPAANRSVNTATAWALLGIMAHAVQDFYAHSTWVADGNANILNFGVGISSGSPPSFLLTPGQIANVCESDGVTLLSPPNPITTGYYGSPLLLYEPLPTGKCQHGTLLNAAKRCGGSSIPADGINHDVDCEFPNDSVNAIIYDQARERARQETIALVQAIVADLEGNNNSAGFCALLDLDATAQFCPDVWKGTITGTASAPCVRPLPAEWNFNFSLVVHGPMLNNILGSNTGSITSTITDAASQDMNRCTALAISYSNAPIGVDTSGFPSGGDIVIGASNGTTFYQFCVPPDQSSPGLGLYQCYNGGSIVLVPTSVTTTMITGTVSAIEGIGPKGGIPPVQGSFTLTKQ